MDFPTTVSVVPKNGSTRRTLTAVVIGGTLAAVAAVGLAAPASAANPAIPASSIECQDDNTYTATWAVPAISDPVITTLASFLTIDGVDYDDVVFPTLAQSYNGTDTVTVTLTGIPGATTYLRHFDLYSGNLPSVITAEFPGDCGPEPVVTSTEWTKTATTCDTKLVTEGRETTTTPAVFSHDTFSFVDDVPVVTTETRERAATLQECPPPLPNTGGGTGGGTPAVTPVVAAAPTLPETGGTIAEGSWMLALGGLIAGAVLLVVRRRSQRA